MTSPVEKLQRPAAAYKQLDAKDKKRYWSDAILNNALR